MAKPQKDRDKKNKNKETGEKSFSQDQKKISSTVEQKIKEALTELNKEKRKDLDAMLEKGEFSEQLRKYFEENHPSLLDEIENQDKLKIYIDQLKNHGFTVNSLTQNAKSLDKSFKESETEYAVTEKSLKKLKEYCTDEKSSLPGGIFDDFARFAKIDSTPIVMDAGSKIQKASDLKRQRNKFIEQEKITLKDTQKAEMGKIMSPKYAPTTRLLVSGAIKKIKKSLPKNLQKSFEERFTLPITITSDIQNLNDLKNEWLLFLQENQKDIDKDTAKKLDNIKVSNQDLYEEYENEGIEYEKGKWFSEQEQAFKIIFNKLATRQLFDDVSKTNSFVETQIENIGEVFKWFPPYINEIFKKYEFNEDRLQKENPKFANTMNRLNEEINALEKQDNTIASWTERKEVFAKIKALKKEKNLARWKEYARDISNKNPKIGNAVAVLIDNNFDVSKLDKGNQQILLDDLVKDKVDKLLAEGTAASLGIDEQRFAERMKDLFDLSKKELTIPGPNGDIVFDCPDKSFLGWPLTKSLEMGKHGPILADEWKQNLPLNIRLLLSEDNKDFFEKSPIFKGLFQEFEARNWTQMLHDGYKVRVTNSTWDQIDGYLSAYPPKGEEEEIENTFRKNKNTPKYGSRYVYYKPITRPEDDRELVFWDKEKNKPAIILENEEWGYEVDVLSREINLNKDGISALLFGSTVGQYAQENKLNSTQTKKLEESFKQLKRDDLYKDTLENKEQTIEEENKPEWNKENTEKESDFDKCIKVWKDLWWYQTIESPKWNGEKPRYGFEKWAKLMFPFFDSFLPPNKDSTKSFLTLEITNIDEKNKTFKVKFTGGETNLGDEEGTEETFALSADGLGKIKKAFWDKAYKLPKDTEKNSNNMISILEQADFSDANPSKSFKDIERSGKWRIKKTGDKTEDVMYFGKTEVSPGGLMDWDPSIETICKVEYHPGRKKPYTVFINDKVWDKEPEKVRAEMDDINFTLFIASKKLSPKTKNEVDNIQKKKEGGPGQALPPKKIPISIANITGFIKGMGKKISEGMKKYEEKQQEDMTEALMFEGKLMSKLAAFMPSDKLKTAFTKVGEEYMLERDNKVWKKIEDWVKFYESDPDFGGPKMRGEKIQPYLEGKIPFKNQWQAAGILLATIKKGKGPYSRNTDRAGKGMWIKILMGEAHQDRYLKMKEKLEKELKEWINLNGQQWANDKQNEILKLEMKYITHVVDGRQLRWNDDDVALQEGKFSKKFAGDLEERSNTFFKDTASGAYNNTKDISFELARFEYFRLLWDRPQQAIANLKAVAEKAVTPSQWKVFESMVLTGMLSGVFNSMTQEDKKFIEKVCRTAGFLPGLLIRQPNVHHKIAKLLNVATGQKIIYGPDGKKKEYNPSNFDFWKIENTGQTKGFANYEEGFNKRYMDNESVIKRFLSFEWKNANDKKLIDIYEDPNTANDIKQILGEIIGKRYETNEELDSDVRGNGKSLQQNLLCRNQSLIDEIIRFQDGSFKGKDKDQVEDAKETRKKITSAMKNNEVKGKTDVIFTLKMFANRFEDKGFNSEQKKFLIRLLKTVKEEKIKLNKKWADQMLRYGIVGRIIRSSGSGQVPDELKAWLETFRDFFEKNLDMILSEEVINEWFGGAYVSALEKPAFKVAHWDEYVKVTEYNKYGYSSDLSPEENKEISKKKKEYSNPIVYINSTIYKMADELEKRDYGVPNAFKEMYDPGKDKKSTKKELEEVLGKNAVVLKNHDEIEKAEKKQNNPENEMTDEQKALYMASEEWGYQDY